MSLAEIEAELENMNPEELRRLALKTWRAFAAKERESLAQGCDEPDPALLAALDEAVAQADAPHKAAYSADQVRARLNSWTTTK